MGRGSMGMILTIHVLVMEESIQSQNMRWGSPLKSHMVVAGPINSGFLML